jgi:hypothetical protein
MVLPANYFGKRPDVTSDLIEHPVPIGRTCQPCRERIAATDRGYLRPSTRTGLLEPSHLECDVLAHIGDVRIMDVLRQSAGHAPSFRDRARAVLDHVNTCRAKAGLEPM